MRVEGPAVAFCAFSGAAKTSFHSSGTSTPRCRFPHIRRTTSSPAFPLALGWNGRMDIVRPALGAPRHRPAGDLGSGNLGLCRRALAGPDSAAVAHKHRKRWTVGSPLHHSAGKRQCEGSFTILSSVQILLLNGSIFPRRVPELYPHAGSFTPIQFLSILRTLRCASQDPAAHKFCYPPPRPVSNRCNRPSPSEVIHAHRQTTRHSLVGDHFPRGIFPLSLAPPLSERRGRHAGAAALGRQSIRFAARRRSAGTKLQTVKAR